MKIYIHNVKGIEIVKIDLNQFTNIDISTYIYINYEIT